MNRFVIYCSIFLALLSAPLVRAVPQTLTDEQITSIRLGCSDALQGLKRIQESEAATRVNRGWSYENMMRLITSLNSRMALNKLDEPTMLTTTAKIQKKLEAFQAHYIAYADKLEATLAIKCTTSPVTFYDYLTEARSTRAIVAQDIVEIDSLFGEYQKGLDRLKSTVARPASGAQQ